MILGGREHAGTFVLRGFKDWGFGVGLRGGSQ